MKTIRSKITQNSSMLVAEEMAYVLHANCDKIEKEILIVFDCSWTASSSRFVDLTGSSFIHRFSDFFKKLLNEEKSSQVRVVVEGRSGVVSSINRNYVTSVDYPSMSDLSYLNPSLHSKRLLIYNTIIFPYLRNKKESF